MPCLLWKGQLVFLKYRHDTCIHCTSKHDYHMKSILEYHILSNGSRLQLPRSNNIWNSHQAYFNKNNVCLNLHSFSQPKIFPLSQNRFSCNTLWVKKLDHWVCHKFKYWPIFETETENFQNWVYQTDTLCRIPVIKYSLKIPPHLICITTLPCEILIYKIWI